MSIGFVDDNTDILDVIEKHKCKSQALFSLVW